MHALKKYINLIRLGVELVRLAQLTANMSSPKNNLGNSYVPTFVSKDLKRYERDGSMTYNDQLKYSEFTDNPDAYIEKTEVVNFDAITMK